jgi:Thiamine pyrophosphate enzyme, N-terminal TPP binding domain
LIVIKSWQIDNGRLIDRRGASVTCNRRCPIFRCAAADPDPLLAKGRIRMELAQARRGRIGARHGGRVLADALVAQGIDHVFEVPGESFLDTLDGLYDQSGKIKLVTCRFEAGAVNMADAFGKLTVVRPRRW